MSSNPDHDTKRRHFIFTDEHERLRESIVDRRLRRQGLAPHAEKREEDKWFESWVFPRMGEFGLLGRSYPEQKTRAVKDGGE